MRMLARWPTWLGGLCGLLYVRALIQSARVQSDTDDLLSSLDGILHCLSAGQWTNCSAAGKWPLLQYLPALPLRWSGGPLTHIGFLLAYLSIAAFVGVLAVTWSTLALRSRLVAAAAVLLLSSGLLLHYSNSSFGEALAAFVATAFVAGWLQRCGAGVVGALALLTTLSKETAVLFVGLLGAICAAVHRERGTTWGGLARQESTRLAGAGCGMALGVALSIGANLFRFGVPYNAAYLREADWAAPLRLQAEFFVALWIAPNAGLVFFWPLLVLALAMLPLVAWTLHRRRAAEVDWLPMIGLGLFLLTLTATLAHWWAPFGWWAWGSRLILPWMPAVLLIAFFAYPAAAEAVVRPVVATAPRAAMFTLVVALLATPHLSSIFRSDYFVQTTFVDRGVCPVPDSPSTYARYYRCIEAQAWEHPSPLLRGYRVVSDPAVRPSAILFALLVVAGGAWLWRERCRGMPTNVSAGARLGSARRCARD